MIYSSHYPAYLFITTLYTPLLTSGQWPVVCSRWSVVNGRALRSVIIELIDFSTDLHLSNEDTSKWISICTRQRYEPHMHTHTLTHIHKYAHRQLLSISNTLWSTSTLGMRCCVVFTVYCIYCVSCVYLKRMFLNA